MDFCKYGITEKRYNRERHNAIKIINNFILLYIVGVSVL